MKKILFSIFMFAFCIPCIAQYELINKDVLVPPSNPINFGQKDVAIVAVHYCNDSTGRASGIVSDSIYTMQTVDEIKYQLEQSPTFENYDIPVFNIYAEKSKIGRAVGNKELFDIYEMSGAEIVIAVHYVNFEYIEVDVDDEKYDFSTKMPETRSTCWITAYDFQTKKVADNYVFRDSTILYDAVELRPSTQEECIDYIIGMIGLTYAKRIVPTWETVDRICYVNSLNFESKKGFACAENDEWSEAIDHWTLLLDSNKKNNRAGAMYNIALACEMLGNYELALQWLDKCEETYPGRVDTKTYADVIKQRIEDEKILDTLQ